MTPDTTDIRATVEIQRVEIERLRALLKAAPQRSHRHGCGEGSLPLVACSDYGPCDCGADAYNAAVNDALASKPAPGPVSESAACACESRECMQEDCKGGCGCKACEPALLEMEMAAREVASWFRHGWSESSLDKLNASLAALDAVRKGTP